MMSDQGAGQQGSLLRGQVAQAKRTGKDKRRPRHELFGRDPAMRAERSLMYALMQKAGDTEISPRMLEAMARAVSEASQRQHMAAHLERVHKKGVEVLLKPMTLDDVTEVDSAYLTAKLREHTQETWRRKAEERRQRMKGLTNGVQYNKSVLPQVLCKGPSGPGFAAGRGRPVREE